MSDNYYLREYYLKTGQAPTQSVMKEKMQAPLAAIYFKMMNPKLKVLAGLEPPMKGAGGDWYVPPKDILEGRAVLKPLKKEYLSKLNYLGIDNICMKIVEQRQQCMKEEQKKMIADNDEKWIAFVKAESAQCFETLSNEAATKNTQILQRANKEFSILYERSINKLESLMYEAACSEIKRIQNDARKAMSEKCDMVVSLQARRTYDNFKDKLETEKTKLKMEFIEKLEKQRTDVGTQIHDVILEKHVAIEKSRQYMQCLSLACQVYVALKEREECEKEIKYPERLHKKKVKALKDEIAYKDYEIFMKIKKEQAQRELNESWKKKVVRIVKTFQMFVSYCLSLLPNQADFFIDLEKIMLLHLDEVLENPKAESIFEGEVEHHEFPTPNPHPYYLCCDKRFTTKELPIRKELCPKHCTSSASNIPVVVINKRLIYAACDNFQQFTNKVKDYLHGHRGDDIDFEDRHDYTQDVPVTYTKSQQLLELKLESSFLQILQQEYENVREVPVVCEYCKSPYCFCTQNYGEKIKLTQIPVKPKPPARISQAKPNTYIDVKTNFPADKYYESYVKPKRCQCGKMAKKHLQQLLPAYMRSKSIDEASLPDYEPCPLHMIKKMARDARGRNSGLPVERKHSKSRDMATQYEDEEFKLLCECLSAEAFRSLWDDRTVTGSKLYHTSITASQFQFINPFSSSTESNWNGSCTKDEAHASKDWPDSPDIEELFKAVRK
ncbi:hypothetical protein HF086_002407 [Spodoptera exigua]|uniref:Uncharacterized protein n=1 Tax=Spodoptera exigua TaxID=7107 RepID=A0A922MFA2_SPOEX|nr:hypothetical protein HF086_002407 [Spodoptera exigua]